MFSSCTLFTEPESKQHFTHKVSLCLVIDGWTHAADFFHQCICIIHGGLKFETKASQVQLFCLHVIHSDVVDTLVMHMKCPFNG